MRRPLLCVLATVSFIAPAAYGECLDAKSEQDCLNVEYRAEMTRVDKYVGMIIEARPNMRDEINEAQALWKKLADLSCHISSRWGGSADGLHYLACIGRAARERLSSLRTYACHPSVEDCDFPFEP